MGTSEKNTLYNGTKKQMRSVCLKSLGCEVPNFPSIRILNRTRCFWEVFLAYFNKAPLLVLIIFTT